MGKVARFEDESRTLTLAYAQLLEARANWQCITRAQGILAIMQRCLLGGPT